MSARSTARSARVESTKLPGRPFEEVREVGPDGKIVVHHRTVDTLGRMLKAGMIDQAMHDAGREFQAAFEIARLDPLRAKSMEWTPSSNSESELSGRQLDARRRESRGPPDGPDGCGFRIAQSGGGHAG